MAKARTLPQADDEQVASFLALPAVGAVELHITEASRPPAKKRSKKLQTSDGVQEVLMGLADTTINGVGGILDTAPADGPDLRTALEVGWVGPAGMLAQIGMHAVPESYQQVLIAARRLRVGVRLSSYDDAQTFGGKSRTLGSLYVPRHGEQLHAGKYQHQIVDTAELFDASIGRMHVPGVLSRKVRRKEPVHVFEQYRQDATWTRIDIQSKKELMTFEALNSEFLGVVRCRNKTYALSTTQTHRIDKQFGQQTNFGSWACDRLMMRLGI